MKTVIDFEGTRVAVKADDSLVAEIAWLKSIIDSAVADGFVLSHGSILTAGWATFRFLEKNGELRVCEPDFDGDPFSNARPDISCSLRIAGRQLAFNAALSARIEKSDWAQSIIIKSDILTGGDFYLERSVSRNREDSGWYIGPLQGDTPSAGQLEVIRSYRLHQLFPQVLDVLLLPVGWIVVFKHRVIDAVLDQEGNSRPFRVGM